MDDDVEPRDTERSGGRTACLGCSKPFGYEAFALGGFVIRTALLGAVLELLIVLVLYLFSD